MRTLCKSFYAALALVAGLQTQLYAQGTAFTYQGRLDDNGAPANGAYDLKFTLCDSSSGGSIVAGPVTNSPVAVSNGLFIVQLDFGAGVFPGPARWLLIGARTNGAAVDFTPLAPRQELTPTPYAITSENLDGTLPASQLTGTLPAGLLAGTYGGAVTLSNAANSFAGNGGALTNVNALTLGGLGPNNFWKTTGNAGTTPGANFVGTTDNQPLEFHVDGNRALRLEFDFFASSPNVIGGGANNSVTGGGEGNFIGSGYANSIGSSRSYSAIAGGFHYVIQSASSSIGGGAYNFVGGNSFETIGGGQYNTNTGEFATIPGGYGNIATGNGSFAAGRNAHTSNDGSFIWGDGSQTANSTGPNCFDVLASGGLYFYSGPAGVNIDQFNRNTNSISYGLRFGAGSGEGIGSKRNAGNNQYGLDFYTGFANRMTIQNDGSMRVYDNTIYLSGAGDNDHGIVHRDSVYGISFGGPFVFGYTGGALGTVGPEEVSLTWDWHGNVWVSNNCSVATLTIRGGADLAEPFEISDAAREVPQGAVVVIDQQNPGHLKISDGPYDTRVAGVVSGANGINPGIQMHQEGLLEGGKNVALTGRVYVQADAAGGAIEPGDLLTTSSIPGHAMKVTDHARAQGAILGKAMTGLSEGHGMVLVLVTLQ
jgi:hypothetical protein